MLVLPKGTRFFWLLCTILYWGSFQDNCSCYGFIMFFLCCHLKNKNQRFYTFLPSRWINTSNISKKVCWSTYLTSQSPKTHQSHKVSEVFLMQPLIDLEEHWLLEGNLPDEPRLSSFIPNFMVFLMDVHSFFAHFISFLGCWNILTS